MPLRLTPEQITDLRDRGAIAPPSSEAPTTTASDTALRVLGNIGLPGSEDVERINEPADTNIDAYPLLKEAFQESWLNLVSFLVDTDTEITLTDNGEPNQAKINWRRLNQSYEAYKQHGISAEVIISPVNLSLKQWDSTYINLHKWLRINIPDANFGLECDNFWVSDNIEANWNYITLPPAQYEAANWNISIVPTAIAPTVQGVSYLGVRGKEVSPVLKSILNLLPKPEAAEDSQLQLPSIETYLTTQALRLYQGKQPIDSGQGTAVSWLKGEILVAGETEDYLAGVYGFWSNLSGAVYLAYKKTDHQSEDMGIRPIVGEYDA